MLNILIWSVLWSKRLLHVLLLWRNEIEVMNAFYFGVTLDRF